MASVAGNKEPVAKITLKTELLMLTREDIRGGGSFIRIVDGEVRIVPPKEEVEKKNSRTVIFECKFKENNKILNPPLEEIIPPFEKWMDEVEFLLRGQEFGSAEFFSFEEEMVYAASIINVDTKKWTFFLTYMGRRTAQIRVGAVPPLVKPEWVLVVLSRTEMEYNIISVLKTETFNFSEYSIEMKIQIGMEDLKKVPDKITLEDRRKLNAVVR